MKIPNSVTYIGSYAFNECNALTGITIPDGVTVIGRSAFRHCDNITSVNIPNGIKYIDYATFAGCGKLTSINLPNSLTHIGESAFSACRFTSITIPASVDTLGDFAFNSCERLTDIDLSHISKSTNMHSRMPSALSLYASSRPTMSKTKHSGHVRTLRLLYCLTTDGPRNSSWISAT